MPVMLVAIVLDFFPDVKALNHMKRFKWPLFWFQGEYLMCVNSNHTVTATLISFVDLGEG